MFGGGAGPGGGGPGGPGGGPGGAAALAADVAAVPCMIFNTGGGGGRGGPLGRLFRQQVNRVRYSFYDRYPNSAFDARRFASPERILRRSATTTSASAEPSAVRSRFRTSTTAAITPISSSTTSTKPSETRSTHSPPCPPPTSARAVLRPHASSSPSPTTPVSTQGSCAADPLQVPIDPVVQGLLDYIPLPRKRPASATGPELSAASHHAAQYRRVNRTSCTRSTRNSTSTAATISIRSVPTRSAISRTSASTSPRAARARIGLSHNWTSRVVESPS